MDKTRFTKGKWVVDTEESYLNEAGVLATPISIENFMIGFVDVYGDQPEDKANALLISKSPEMLEMLQDIVNNHYIDCDVVNNEIKQLIKEATTI